MPPVLFIVGATASGKTAAALSLAGVFSVELVNADSRQVYHGMNIGTAKPSPAEQAAVTHHLLDVVEPDEPYSLALFLGQARAAIAEALGRRRLPVVVGGTGQYVWGLAEGWQVPAVAPQLELRERLESEARQQGVEALHRRLERIDSAAARSIDPRNVRRVIRALEVWQTTGKRFSSQRRRVSPPFVPHVFGLQVPRDELDRRIGARAEDMMAHGWLEEVRQLLTAGYTPELPSFSSAGYRELAAHVRGELDADEALRRTKASVRRLARRQGAWFRSDDPRITWAATVEELARRAAPLCQAAMIQFASHEAMSERPHDY